MTNQKTDQELFDLCVGFTLKQGCYGYDVFTEQCCYLTTDGKSCSIGGPLIEAGFDVNQFEGVAVSRVALGDTVYRKVFLKALDSFGVSLSQHGLLAGIQHTHDLAAKEDHSLLMYARYAINLARSYKLSPAIPQAYIDNHKNLDKTV